MSCVQCTAIVGHGHCHHSWVSPTDFLRYLQLVKQLMNRQYPLIPKISFPVADVRDVALAHIRAMMIKQAAGNNVILVLSTPSICSHLVVTVC